MRKYPKRSVFGTKGPNLEFSENDNDLWERYEAEERELKERYAKLLQERRDK